MRPDVKPIPGFPGYVIAKDGAVYRVERDGFAVTYRDVSPSVQLVTKGGKSKTIRTIARLMRDAGWT